MSFKEQWLKLKENSLLILLIFIIFFIATSFNSINTLKNTFTSESGLAEVSFTPRFSEDFVPKIEERQITKTANLEINIKRGEFKSKSNKLKDLIKSTDSLLITENVRELGQDLKYFRGSYQIKIEKNKYKSFLTQTKQLGKITSFIENAKDITETILSLTDELKLEKERLTKFETMFLEAENVNDRIELTDRIINIERQIKFLENQLMNQKRKIQYSTIYLSLNEKPSNFAGISIIGISVLIKNLVKSFNGILSLLFVLFPWAITVLIIWIGYKFFKKK